MYGLIHIAISVEGFALFLVFILWRQQETEALLPSKWKQTGDMQFSLEVGLEVYKSIF